MAATEQLFNVRERKRFERHDIWERIAENGTISAAVMVFAAIAAVICANTDAYEAIHHFLETPLYVGLGNLTAGLTVELFVNDFLMAIFFLLVGIELKYEMTVGELKNPRQAMLPMLAAVGGVVVPACIYLIFNHAGARNGWAIPMATDIAFALGVLSLLGNSVPNGVRVFFSTLAIADDLISIAAIAICLLVSRVIGVEKIEEEVTLEGKPFRRKRIFNFMIKYLCPIFAAIILISSVANALGVISM